MAELPRRAPVALVAGGIKVFVNDVAQLGAVVAALQAQPQSGSALGLEIIAAAAARVMQEASQSYPDCRVRSLRDVAWCSQGKMAPHLLRFVQQLNAAYSLLRHVTAPDFERTMDEIAEALAQMRLQAEPDGAQPDKGPTDQATSMVQQAHLDEVMDAELDAQTDLGDNPEDHFGVSVCPPVTQMCTSVLPQVFPAQPPAAATAEPGPSPFSEGHCKADPGRSQTFGDACPSTVAASSAASGGAMSLDTAPATDSQAGSVCARRSPRRKPAQKRTRIDRTRASKLEEYEATLIKRGARGLWEAELQFFRWVLSSWRSVAKAVAEAPT